MALLLIPGEEPLEIQPSPNNNGRFTLKQLQALVGGYVAYLRKCRSVQTGPGKADLTMAVDEDGLMKRDPVTNPLATIASMGQRIVGNAVLMRPEEVPR